MAAFTAANELSEEELIAHTLGTDLGTGWVLPGGLIPKIPLELYDIILDLGSYPSRRFLPEDLRSTRNENSSLPGARRYLGQAAAYRLAWELDPALLKGYFHGDASSDRPILIPGEQRKACLSHLMDCAESGNQLAEELFRRIGLNFGVMSCEMDFLLHPPTKDRYLYGRFVKSRRCFELLQEGCRAYSSEFTIYAPDEETANTPLMKQLAERPDVSVAQFGQAIGAIYFAASSA